MELEDFVINQVFLTATGEWYCIDIGTKSIVAIKVEDKDQKIRTVEVDNVTREIISVEDSVRRVEWEEIKKHPDLFDYVVFWEYDFGGCYMEGRNS